MLDDQTGNTNKTDIDAYTENLLKRNEEESKKLYNTKLILNRYMDRHRYNVIDLHVNTFNFNRTTLPITEYTITMIITLFPNTKTLIATLKPNTNPVRFLFDSLNYFSNLKNLHLTMTDGLSGTFRTKLMIKKLKLYTKALCGSDTITRGTLRKVCGVESLAIREGTLTIGSSAIIARLPIEKLSLKNIIITRSETKSIEQTINALDITHLKLIYTGTCPQQNKIMTDLITQYINKLPHPNLKEFSFTLPHKSKEINYLQLLYKLNLNRLRIFLKLDTDYNTIDQIIGVIHLSPPNLSIEIVYYKTDLISKYSKDDFDKLAIYTNLKISEKENPYTAFPRHSKKEINIRSLAAYKRAIYENKNSPKILISPYKNNAQQETLTSTLYDESTFIKYEDLIDEILKEYNENSPAPQPDPEPNNVRIDPKVTNIITQPTIPTTETTQNPQTNTNIIKNSLSDA